LCGKFIQQTPAGRGAAVIGHAKNAAIESRGLAGEAGDQVNLHARIIGADDRKETLDNFARATFDDQNAIERRNAFAEEVAQSNILARVRAGAT